MTSSQIILQEPIPWWFYIFMIGFIAIAAWMGFTSTKRLRALFLLKPLRKVAQEASVPTKAISVVTWYSAIVSVALFVLVICGTWVIVRDNFFSFRQLVASSSSVRLSYEWSFLDQDIPLASLQNIEVSHVIRRKYHLVITTTAGKVYRSTTTDDFNVVSECRDFASKLQKMRYDKP